MGLLCPIVMGYRTETQSSREADNQKQSTKKSDDHSNGYPAQLRMFLRLCSRKIKEISAPNMILRKLAKSVAG